ncbi:MAG TPA: GMP reductase [Dehalococcoidia bacterium]|jgi:GMP reductase|nr:GMP reductase [Dehalococcoidia bacterium]
MRIEREVKLDFEDVLIRPKRSTLYSRKLVNLTRTFEFKFSKTSWTGIPIIAANMDTIGTFEMAKVLSKHQMLTAIHKFYNLEDWVNALKNGVNPEYLSISAGIDSLSQIKDQIENLTTNKQKIPKFICLDVANGYTEKFIDTVKTIRETFPNPIIAGNVVTGEMTEALILAGADIVKVGIGPGSVCTTRMVTGVGYPQLSAIVECSDAAHGLGGHVISDGGCKYPGDISKAFGAGADFVMLGGMFAGHLESGGELFEENGMKYKRFYGMSSDTAMERHYGEIESYRASEGKTVTVPYKGEVENTLRHILGGLRSAATYVGARTIKEIPKCTTFVLKNSK